MDPTNMYVMAVYTEQKTLFWNGNLQEEVFCLIDSYLINLFPDQIVRFGLLIYDTVQPAVNTKQSFSIGRQLGIVPRTGTRTNSIRGTNCQIVMRNSSTSDSYAVFTTMYSNKPYVGLTTISGLKGKSLYKECVDFGRLKFVDVNIISILKRIACNNSL